MTEQEMKALKPGDLIIHPMHNGRVSIVTDNDGKRITAVQTFDVSNPIEWEIIRIPTS